MLVESCANGIDGGGVWPWATRWPLRCWSAADFKAEDFAALHPGGRLGKKLRRVER